MNNQIMKSMPNGTVLATYEGSLGKVEVTKTKDGVANIPASPLLRGLRPGAIVPQQEQFEEADDGKPSLQFANFSGDITVTWEPSQHEMMKKLIEQKMRDGYRFFIVKKRGKIATALLGAKKVEIKDPSELDKAEALQVPTGAMAAFVAALDDKDVANAIMAGDAKLTKGTKRDKDSELVPSKDAEQIARSKAVAIRPVVGG